MKKIEVYHLENDEYVHVADVNVPDPVVSPKDTESMILNTYLEYAHRWTNNTEGSWSRQDLGWNVDYNPFVDVLVDLPEYNGKIYGIRSTSMDDKLIMDGIEYLIDAFGFKRI